VTVQLEKIVKTEIRELQGSKFRKAHPDKVPGVVYGNNQEPISIALDPLTLNKIFDIFGHSTIFDLDIDGMKEPISVLLHQIDRHPNTNNVISFDMYAITKGQKLTTEVSITFEGNAPAASDSSKVITTIIDTIEIEALPVDLPEQVVVDISNLVEVGDAKYVSDLNLGDKITVLTDPEAALIKVGESRVEEAEPETVVDSGDVEVTGQKSDDSEGSESKDNQESSN
jgi:large subunit ribosomal protein L25